MLNRDNSYLVGNKHAVGNPPNGTAFKKGQKPWNKGKKGIHCSPDTEFKKGRESSRKLPLGSITTRKRKRDGRSRQFIKVAEPAKWIEYARHLWVANYGPLKKGDIIHHIDGDTLNDNIKNLIAIPRSHHPYFHSKWGLKPIPTEQLDAYRERYRPCL